MNKYNVRHIEGLVEEAIENYKMWVCSRKHITITDTKMIKEGNRLHIVITFMEERYDG